MGRLPGLMRARLALMHDVARSKWISGRPISDPERERVLLDETEGQGREQGLDPQWTRAFFAAQVEAAKFVQEADFARWRAAGHGPSQQAADLAELRQRIDRLDRELLAAPAQTDPWPCAAEVRAWVLAWAQQALTGDGIDDAVHDTAITPLVSEP